MGPERLPIGTLCVIDHEPKALSSVQRQTLDVLGRQVATHLELRLKIAQMREQAHAREESLKVKEQFMANVSHELRTPLNSIIGFSQVLRQDPTLPKSMQEHVKVMHESGKHLLGLINDVLDMSRIEAGKVRLQMENHDPRDLFGDIISLFSMRAREKGLSLNLVIDDDLPDKVEFDGRRFRQIMINLMGNAVKFTDAGEVTLSVRLLKRDGNQGRLLVEESDTGRGMEPHELNRLFQPFEQADSNREGTGLGLSIASKLVELFGGQLEAKSVAGEGSTFVFEMNLRFLGVEGKKKVQVKTLDGSTRLVVEEDKRRALIVDDIMSNRMLCKVILEVWGFDVREAEDGVEAVEMAHEWKPNLVLMDLVMPRMSGKEAASRLRDIAKASGWKVDIIDITASFFGSPEKQFGNLDVFDDLLSKPFRAEELHRILQEEMGYQFSVAGEKMTNPRAKKRSLWIGSLRPKKKVLNNGWRSCFIKISRHWKKN